MNRLIALIMATALCVSMTAASAAISAEARLPRCNEQVLASYRGRLASPALGRRMLRATGARTLRWVRPGMMVTMDYRFDRLTVRTGHDGRILAAACD